MLPLSKNLEFRLAIEEGDLPWIQTLSIDPDVNLEEGNPRGWTPFAQACLYGHVDIVRYLLDFDLRPIDYNRPDRDGSTPFSLVCGRNDEAMVEMLLEDERIDVNQESKGSGQTPLWLAAACGHVEVVEIMLASGRQFDLGKVDADENTSAAQIAQKHANRPQKYVWESEGEYQQKLERFRRIAGRIGDYERDPLEVQLRLRKELGFAGPMAGKLFALVVYASDGYLVVVDRGEEEDERRVNAKRFFKLAIGLPLDLQMVLCNRVFGLAHSIIPRSHSEKGFVRFAKSRGWRS